MKKPLVSVVTISYNHEKYIRGALESFINQKVDFEYEVLIADDNSTDSTARIIKQLADKHPDVIKPIYRKKNVGAVDNFVDNLKRASGIYVAICDGDDYWTDEHKLQKQVDYMKAHADVALCFSPCRVVYQNKKQNDSVWPMNIKPQELTVKKLLDENFVPTNAVMYRRQSYDKLSSEPMPFDWYMHLYHAQFGKIGYINEVMSVYRRHDGGVWWNSHSAPGQHWKKYGLQILALFEQARKIYGKEPELNEQITKSVATIYRQLVRGGDDLSEDITKPAVQAYSDLAASTINFLSTDRQNLEEDVAEKTQSLLDLENEVMELKSENFRQKADIQQLRNSRVVGRVIKARESVGDIKQKIRQLPRQLVTRTKRGISGVTPEAVKPPIRALVLKPARKMIGVYDKSRDKNSPMYQGSVVTVINKEWNSKAPLVSIVVPYYNRASTIDETIESVFDQTLKDYELIIVDDGSTEKDSIDKIKKIKKDHPSITIIEQKNQGVAAARNNGIKYASGKYIICLDSDDCIDPTYVEKCSILLELNQEVALVTSYRTDIGVVSDEFRSTPYDPIDLYKNNMVTTAAQFRKKAWEVSGGYKSDLGYEDWEFWLNLAEHGFWGKLLPEFLFIYRVAVSSRFMDDKEAHWGNIKRIQEMHKQYSKNIKLLAQKRKGVWHISTPKSTFVNLNTSKNYSVANKSKPQVLITIPWMTFGGAETLIYNYCREIKDQFNISFVTGLPSEHEWEYKFKEITPNVYHMDKLFGTDKDLYLEFLSNYIATRDINILNIIHNGFTFEFLEELKRRHPKLKVVVTMFNDRVGYFEQSVGYEEYIDSFVSDNLSVANHYRKMLSLPIPTNVIPNGINCFDEFNPDMYDRAGNRKDLGLEDNDLAVFFVGRLSIEKNPNIFVQVAEQIGKNKKLKVKFFLVGGGPMDQEIADLIEASPNAQITNLGYQSDVASFLSAADVFVLPSSIEGFPLSILEALAMKVVVVASDVGAIAEVVDSGRDGYVVTPGSVEEISKAVHILATDKKLLSSMKNKSREKAVELYSNKALGKNYANLYKGLLE